MEEYLNIHNTYRLKSLGNSFQVENSVVEISLYRIVRYPIQANCLGVKIVNIKYVG